MFEVRERTDRHTDTFIAILCAPSGGEVIIYHKTAAEQGVP